MSDVNGFLNLNKPPGKSSFAMVGLVRKLTGLRRVGHGGTLDPGASGVLPICLGQATRMSEFLLSARKRYVAGITLGVETDSYDADGNIVDRRDPSHVTQAQVEDALGLFRGAIQQVPPMFSALKRAGQPLYKLARAGIEVERNPRAVHVYSLEIIAWQPPHLDLEVECSRGTYIRSLAHDLGAALGCGAHLDSLCRTQAGPFVIDDAMSVEELFDAAHGGYLGDRLYTMDWVVTGLPAAILDDDAVVATRQGRLLRDSEPPAGAREPSAGELCRAYGETGDLLALLTYDGERTGWQPSKVFLSDSVD